jgi:hypothetical protein
MNEYSVYFNPPGFNDYPRTVQDTVDHVALNAHVDKPALNDIYVTGSTVPSAEDNNKIWIHYPNSTIPPPEPGVDPNLPIPPPAQYFPGASPTISAFFPNPSSSAGVFFDPATGYTWSLPTGSSSSYGLTAYNALGVAIFTFNNPYPGSQAYYSMVKTPGGKLFVAYTSQISFQVFNLFIFEVVGSTLSNASFVLRGSYTGFPTGPSLWGHGVCYDASGNIYVTVTIFTGSGSTYTTEIYKMDGSSYVISQLTTTLPSPYSSNFSNSLVVYTINNSSGNILFIAGRPPFVSLPSIYDVLSINTSTGVGTVLTSFSSPGNIQVSSSIGIDSSDSLYFASYGSHRVYKLTSGGSLSVYAGTGVAGNLDALLLNAQFNQPRGVFISGGNLFLADSGNSLMKSTTNPLNTPTIGNPTYFGLITSQATTLQIVASNSPTSYNATNLPGGLSVNTSTGLISGTPTTPGIYTVILYATNSFGGTSQGIILQVLDALPTNYFNTPALRRFSAAAWNEFSSLTRGDIIVAPEEENILFPWGESDKVYDLSPWGESNFTVPTLPTPPTGFKYKYYIGAQISQPTPPVITP